MVQVLASRRRSIIELWPASLCSILADFFTQYDIEAQLKNGGMKLILGNESGSLVSRNNRN